MMPKKQPRVTQDDPLCRLMSLAAQAEAIECELYALPCARPACPVPCREHAAELGSVKEVCGDGPWQTWCDPCRAWWMQSRVTGHLMRCVRIQRSIQAARADPARALPHDPECRCGECSRM